MTGIGLCDSSNSTERIKIQAMWSIEEAECVTELTGKYIEGL